MKEGNYVRYIEASDSQAAWGGCQDPRGVLIPGRLYKLEWVDVHGWHTKLHLEGVGGGFNSVCFEEVEV